MLIRTHIAITLLAVLLFINSVESKITFFAVALVATFIPDIDTAFSKLGHHKVFRPLQFFVTHRGFIHSFTFLFLITLFFVLFFPVAALPLFLGYGLHLFADCFTINGIKPFYPWGRSVSGKIKTGGKVEVMIFIFFILVDLFLLIVRFTGVF